MPYCAHCGSPTAEDAAFCTQCGRRIAPAAAAQPIPDPAMTQPLRAQPGRVLPPPAATFQGPGAQAPLHNTGQPVDVPAILRRLVGGSWLGPALVAATAVGVAGALSLLIAVMVKPTDFGLDNSLTLVAWLTTNAFGADLNVHAGVMAADIRASLAAAPLTVTVGSLLSTALVFRRTTRRHPNVGTALFDAVRAALLAASALMVVALVFRSGGKEFGRGWGNELAHLFDARLDFAPNALGAFLGGFLMMLVVLAGATLMRTDWWPVRLQQVADLLTAPAYGVASLALLLPVAGLVGLGLALLTGQTVQDSDPTAGDVWSSIGLFLALLANGGYWFLALGSGAAFGASGSASDSSSDRDVHHLGHYAGDAWGLWLAPVVLLMVLLLATRVVVRRAAPQKLVRDLVLWVLAVLVMGPVLTYLSGLHADMDVAGLGDNYTAHGTIGVVGWQVTLLMTLVTGLVAAGFLWRAGRLGELADVARSLGGTQPSGPPPPPPPAA